MNARDDRHGGYGDTSALPSLAPLEEKGAAATAALSAVLELQREIATSPVEPVPDASAAEPAPGAVAQSAPAAEPARTVTAPTPLAQAPSATVPVTPASDPRPATRPIIVDTPAIQLDGLDLDDLTVAERLGLASDEDEVGPTS